jgi:hypothetical protein
MALNRSIWLLAAALTLRPLLTAQTAAPDPTRKEPQLKLEIIPLKRSYRVGEIVFVRYKLTGLADGTLCFPVPAEEAQVSVAGYMLTEANPLTSDEKDKFIEVYDARFPTDEQLRSDITTKWIKLGMSEPYKPKQVGKVTVLTESGQWTLQSTYHPPELNAREFSIVESLGCSPPNAEVHSTPVTITVLSSSN